MKIGRINCTHIDKEETALKEDIARKYCTGGRFFHTNFKVRICIEAFCAIELQEVQVCDARKA